VPQLDFHTPLTISQVVWMFLIFLALYLLLARWALPQVGSVVEGRAARIGADLDGARTAKAESEAAIAEVAAAVHRASAEAQGQIAAALEEAKAEAARQNEQASVRLDAQLAEAERRIGEARASALTALREVASDTATSLIAKLTGNTPEPGRVLGAVDRALSARAAVAG